MEEFDPEEYLEDYMDIDSLEDQELPEGHKSGFVAVVGRPNVGKSTLMNALLRQKVAIVTPRPQTTRIRQLGIVTEDDHQIVFMDTPGIIRPRNTLDEYMTSLAMETLAEADVVVWIVDASEPPGAGDRGIAETLQQLPAAAEVILVMNKNDLLQPDEVIPRTEAYRALLPETDTWILISAKENAGLDTLYDMILAALPEGPRYYPADQVTDLFMRDIAAELIREQVLLQIREEIPHGVAVQVEEFKERETGLIYINATVFVERENHKKIVIGARGSMLRDIGAAARKEIERMLGTRVYLDLWVKAAPKWRSDEAALRRFGYAAG